MTSLIPTENWEYSLIDLFRGVKDSLHNTREGQTIPLTKVGQCIPIRSGRAALVIALEELDLKPGARIGVPLYSCPVVFKAIVNSGNTPIFIDIERDSFCISVSDLSRKSHQVDAVIVIHMFGNLCDMDNLLQSVPGKPIIEDCAQSLGSELDGRMCGTIGTIGIFSFRSGKYLSVGEGGALYSNNPLIMSRLQARLDEMSTPPRSMEIKHSIKTYLRTKLRSRPLFGILGKKIWKMYNQNVDFAAKTPIIIGKIFSHDHHLASRRLLHFAEIIRRQRANADYFSNNLKMSSEMISREKQNTACNRFLYPLHFSSTEQRDAMAAYLFKKKIDTIKPYQNITEIAADYYGYQGDCPVAEHVAKTTLVIPSYYTLKKDEIRFITTCINNGWEEIATCQPQS